MKSKWTTTLLCAFAIGHVSLSMASNVQPMGQPHRYKDALKQLVELRDRMDSLIALADCLRQREARPQDVPACPPLLKGDLSEVAVTIAARTREMEAMRPSGIASIELPPSVELSSPDAHLRRRAIANHVRALVDIELLRLAESNRSSQFTSEADYAKLLTSMLKPLTASAEYICAVPANLEVCLTLVLGDLDKSLADYHRVAQMQATSWATDAKSLDVHRSNLAGNLLEFIASERTKLAERQAEGHERLEATTAAIKSLSDRRAHLTPREQQAERMRSDMQTLQNNLTRTVAQRDQSHAALSAARIELTSIERNLAVPFEASAWRCPNNATYAGCSHIDLKRAYDNNKNQLNQQQTAKRQQITTLEQRISGLDATARATQSRIDSLAQAIYAHEQALDADIKAIARELEIAMQSWREALSDPSLVYTNAYLLANDADARVARQFQELHP